MTTLRGVGLADGGHLVAGDEGALRNHVVGVAGDRGVVIHVGHDLLQELADLVVRASRGELAEEDLLARGEVGGVADVFLEVLNL